MIVCSILLLAFISFAYTIIYKEKERDGGINHRYCKWGPSRLMWIEIAEQTLTAESIDEPFASSAAMQDAKVQPVPWVLRVLIRGEQSS